jgi:hypothetical protein
MTHRRVCDVGTATLNQGRNSCRIEERDVTIRFKIVRGNKCQRVNGIGRSDRLKLQIKYINYKKANRNFPSIHMSSKAVRNLQGIMIEINSTQH